MTEAGDPALILADLTVNKCVRIYYRPDNN